MKLSYDLINEKNIKLAQSIQGSIFPGESAISHYEYSIENNYQNCSYYIVKYNDIPVGITGIYIMNMYKKDIENNDSVWLGWYGVLPEFRGLGIGKTTLLDTIEKAKKYNKKYFRLYTSCTEKDPAFHLYKSVMQKYELYQNEKDYNYDGKCIIFSYSLKGRELESWNNRYAYLNEDIKMEEKSNKKLNNYYKIFIKLSDDINQFNQTEKLATLFREDGHLVTLEKKLNNTKNYDLIIENIPKLTTNNIEEIFLELKNKLLNNIKRTTK